MTTSPYILAAAKRAALPIRCTNYGREHTYLIRFMNGNMASFFNAGATPAQATRAYLALVAEFERGMIA